jgi:hypothetical protein
LRQLLPLLLVVACTRASSADISAGLQALQVAAHTHNDDPTDELNDRAAVLANACAEIRAGAGRCEQSFKGYAHTNPNDRVQVLAGCADFDPKREGDHARWVLGRVADFVEAGRRQLTVAQAQQLD